MTYRIIYAKQDEIEKCGLRLIQCASGLGTKSARTLNNPVKTRE